MTNILEEKVGREALIALAQYPSVTSALAEIIDNPFDYTSGRFLTLELTMNKSAKTLHVLDHGGEGMDDSSLADWILWGTGHRHRVQDIGQWHVGGKLAAIYLAESLEIVCRRHGDDSIYRFLDPKWGTRTSLFSGQPLRLTTSELVKYPRLSELPVSTGFTLFIMRKLKPHRYEAEILRSQVANTYRNLLEKRRCRIVIDGLEATPFTMPESSVCDPIVIPTQKLAGGVTVKGRIAVIDRDRLEQRRGLSIQAGIRTVFNGRLIIDGEAFGHNLSGRGQLQRLLGEIELQHISPNATKNNWDRDGVQWEALEAFMHQAMQPLVTFLNQLGDSRQVSRDQKKRAEKVRRQVSDALKKLAERAFGSGDLSGEIDSPGGRKPAQPGIAKEPISGRERGEVRHRTEPPTEAVGRLLRRFRGGVPEIEFDFLGRGQRSQWGRNEAGQLVIVVNKDYPLYEELGETESYLAETVIRHILGEPFEGEELPSFGDWKQKLDETLWAWREVAETT